MCGLLCGSVELSIDLRVALRHLTRMTELPILYSFRRCPYAMRARLAIQTSGLIVELREIVLRDKAPEFLETSPSNTVPCLKDRDAILDESLDIMLWALDRSDPENWMRPEQGDKDGMISLIQDCDGPFKHHLDRYKYDTRYNDVDKEQERSSAAGYLWDLNELLKETPWLFGNRASLADFAVLPFVRQFANTDRDWFEGEEWTALKGWLKAFEDSDRYRHIMPKWEKWKAGDSPVLFPDP
ncbi:glutaredoxin 2 [Roseibium album]|nr:glutaredoxin 2 [Roseibium album]